MRIFGFGGPEHCTTCGDAFIEVSYTDGFHRDGTPNIRRWKKCPRNPDRTYDYLERHQVGRCMRPPHFACINERRAYFVEHRPWERACSHYSVSDDGKTCRLRDGTIVTGQAA